MFTYICLEWIWSEFCINSMTCAGCGVLQRAHAEEDPTGNAFWQRVAQQVPGKDAQQCFSKFWAGNPTPAPSRAAGPRAYLDAVAASSPLAPPARTTAAGAALGPAPPLPQNFVCDRSAVAFDCREVL